MDAATSTVLYPVLCSSIIEEQLRKLRRLSQGYDDVESIAYRSGGGGAVFQEEQQCGAISK